MNIPAKYVLLKSNVLLRYSRSMKFHSLLYNVRETSANNAPRRRVSEPRRQIAVLANRLTANPRPSFIDDSLNRLAADHDDVDAILSGLDELIEAHYTASLARIPWLDSHRPTARLQLIIDGQFDERMRDVVHHPRLPAILDSLGACSPRQAITALSRLTLLGVDQSDGSFSRLLAIVSRDIDSLSLRQLSAFCNQFRTLPKGCRVHYMNAILRRYAALLGRIDDRDALRDVTDVLKDVSYFMSRSLLASSFRRIIDYAETPAGRTLDDPAIVVNIAYVSRRMFYSRAVDYEFFDKLLRYSVHVLSIVYL